MVVVGNQNLEFLECILSTKKYNPCKETEQCDHCIVKTKAGNRNYLEVGADDTPVRQKQILQK
jgi:hypothetical protein